jgi:hypothetical protein
VETLLDQDSCPGASTEELELFKIHFRTSAYTCRLRSCPRATVGFSTGPLRREHEIGHAGGFRCSFPNCHYPPFRTTQALDLHSQNNHTLEPTRKSIRRVRRLPSEQPRTHSLYERNTTNAGGETAKRSTSIPGSPTIQTAMKKYLRSFDDPSFLADALGLLVPPPPTFPSLREIHQAIPELGGSLGQLVQKFELRMSNVICVTASLSVVGYVKDGVPTVFPYSEDILTEFVITNWATRLKATREAFPESEEKGEQLSEPPGRNVKRSSTAVSESRIEQEAKKLRQDVPNE